MTVGADSELKLVEAAGVTEAAAAEDAVASLVVMEDAVTFVKATKDAAAKADTEGLLCPSIGRFSLSTEAFLRENFSFEERGAEDSGGATGVMGTRGIPLCAGIPSLSNFSERRNRMNRFVC